MAKRKRSDFAGFNHRANTPEKIEARRAQAAKVEMYLAIQRAKRKQEALDKISKLTF